MNKKLNYFSAIKFLSKYMNKYKKNLIMYSICWLLNTFFKVYMAIMFAIMVDEIVYYKNIDTFMKVSLNFTVLIIFSCILYYLSETQRSHLSVMYSYEIKRDIFDTILSADAQYLSDINSGDVVNTIQFYTDECMYFVLYSIIHVLLSIIQILIHIVFVFLLGWQIGLLMIATVPLSVFVSFVFGRKIRKYAENQRESYSKYSGWLFEMLSGMRDILMLGARKIANKAFIKHQKKLIHLNIRNNFLTQTARNVIMVVNVLIQLAIFSVAAIMTLQNNMTIGVLTLILAYFTTLTNYISSLSGDSLAAQKRISYIQHIYDMMNIPSEREWSGDKGLIVTNCNIEFKNVHFEYNNENTVLDGFNLSINGGERIAVIGKSGSGKTTLAYMLIGFYSPDEGDITIDGQKLSDCSLLSIRDQIGIIQQDCLIIDGTIRENLLLGKRNATNAEILSACERAGILDYVQSLPDGINTVVGKNGIGLSGGQRQRLSIARIYLKNPPIIIFDEATSALDMETEKQIHEEWKKVLTDRTAIVIAHRQSSVMLCDRVAILEDGRLAQTGTPGDLLQTSEAFKTLFNVRKETSEYA